MVVIIGECRAGELFGNIFPPLQTVKAACAEINAENAAVIVCDDVGARIKQALGIITRDDCEADLPRGVQLITCGRGEKNAVSITSRTSDKITLSLNRPIRTKSGVTEPLELPVDLCPEIDEFSYMSAFAASLLLS